MEIFYIEACRWMTEGATRGRGGEIITKIVREANQKKRKRERGLQLYTTVTRLAVADRKRGAQDDRNR